MAYQYTFKIYDYIYQYKWQNGQTPQLKEIALALGLTPRTIWRHLQLMEIMGMVCREQGRREITLLTRQPDWDRLAPTG